MRQYFRQDELPTCIIQTKLDILIVGKNIHQSMLEHSNERYASFMFKIFGKDIQT